MHEGTVVILLEVALADANSRACSLIHSAPAYPTDETRPNSTGGGSDPHFQPGCGSLKWVISII
jgi:hypothetical protein